MNVTASATGGGGIYLDVAAYLMWLPAQCPCRYKCDRGHVGLQLSSGKPIPRSRGRDNQIVSALTSPWSVSAGCPRPLICWSVGHARCRRAWCFVPKLKRAQLQKLQRDQKCPIYLQFLIKPSFKVKHLEQGTDKTLCAQGFNDRFSSLWPLLCVVRFPGVEAHISTRDATVSGIRGRQGPDREAGAAAGVNRWGADWCSNVADIFMF